MKEVKLDEKGIESSCVRFLTVLLVAMMTVLAGCGGGGGGGSSPAAAQTGTVAVFVKDGPAEQFEHIWVTITQVELLPVSGSPVVIYDNPSGCRIDILDHRDEDFLLKIHRSVPAGQYSKIRLRVTDIDLMPASGSTIVTDESSFPAERSTSTRKGPSPSLPAEPSPYAWISMPTRRSMPTRAVIRTGTSSGPLSSSTSRRAIPPRSARSSSTGRSQNWSQAEV